MDDLAMLTFCVETTYFEMGFDMNRLEGLAMGKLLSSV